MIYAVSDLHGFPLDKFKKFLNQINFTKNDFLYILGDVIDRGSDSVKLLFWIARQANMQMLLGNHEQMLLNSKFIFDEITEVSANNLTTNDMSALSLWIANGAEPTLAELKRIKTYSPELIDDILSFLEELPLYETVSTDYGDFILTHAGLGSFNSEKKLSEYTAKELIWARPKISDRYFSDITTVFGHTPTANYADEYKGLILRTDTWINIDTGAAFGENPAIIRLDDLKEFYYSE